MGKQLLHTPEGVKDIYGEEYAKKLEVERRLHENIRLYGYEEIQTPAFEFFDVFSKEIGTTPSRELYKFFDKDNNTLVLRPDFTPSIARCAAKYFGEDNIPLRFSYLGNTFTNTSDLQGKVKESTQMGAELIGDDSVEADGEIISLVIKSLLHAGLKRFQVTIGEVEYFKGLCGEAGLDEETEPYHSRLLKVADMFGDMCSLQEAGAMVKNPRSLGAIKRLEKLYQVLQAYGVSEYISFDLGMLSKYKYYTGVIFKAYTYGVGDAVVKGGRYDGLLRQFGKEAPAVGFCMVIDSILEALFRQKVKLPLPEPVQIVSYSPDNFSEKLAEAQQLRAEGKATVLRKAACKETAIQSLWEDRKNGHQ